MTSSGQIDPGVWPIDRTGPDRNALPEGADLARARGWSRVVRATGGTPVPLRVPVPARHCGGAPAFQSGAEAFIACT
jgi:hypothetical protein